MPAELTGVTRLAAPMSRRDMTFDSTANFGTNPGSGVVGRATLGPSTFRHGVGQVVPFQEPRTLTPKSGRKVVLTLMGGMVLAGLAIVMASRTKHESRRAGGMAAASNGPAAPARAPSAVRINFSSDPDGAIVTRADDGSELGRTPLSLEIPYSDAPVQFVLRKPGFEDKMMLIVPNLPAPIFATLRSVDKPVLPGAPAGFYRRPPGWSSRKAVAAPTSPATSAPGPKASNAPLDDDVLAPDFK
jgi:hypothetical protein